MLARSRLPAAGGHTRARGTLVLRCSSIAHQPQGAGGAAVLSGRKRPASHIHDASLDLGPYMLWDKARQLQAVWDARAQSQADLQRLIEVLEENALDKVTISTLQGNNGQDLTALTVVCAHDQCEEAAAALLKWTPATHVSATECEQCYLPQHTVSVDTRFGRISLHLSLAGSRVCKVGPDWQQCSEAAAAAVAGVSGAEDGVDAAGVAAAAVEQLHAGLEDGSIELGIQNLY